MRQHIGPMRTALAAVLLLILAGILSGNGSGVTLAAPSSDGIWRDVNPDQIVRTGSRLISPTRYRVLAADLNALTSVLGTAPLESAVKVRNSNAVISLPLPDGTFGRFRFVDSPIMEAPLAAKYPEIKTYLGQGIDDPTATVRFDRTPAGFHALILSAAGAIFIDPYQRADTTHYISYYKKDFVGAPSDYMIETAVDLSAPQDTPEGRALPPSGTQLRTYRAAIAATGEYTLFHGGTVPQGLAAIVTSLNRVDGVYENDVAVRMILIANNDQIVYTDSTTDPYTNNNGSQMLGQNQTNLDAVIGNANYDIGHVFSTGGGGVANLGVPCRTGFKARGVTGSPQPVGDPFDIDYVAHEMGHQYGANHTFNGTTTNCGGGNRSGAHAYEPGSGSTIMAYAGICGAEDLQPHSDPYFHVDSFDAIVAYTTVGQGNTCPTITETGNNPPTVNPGSTYTIPNQTSFKITGGATDPDSDPLTYDWEQFDLGTASPPNTDNGNRPIFRSFNPVTVPYRYLPRMSDILSNTLTLGEAYPTTNRILTFRLTARDNRAGGGGVNYASLILNVTTTSGPFLVTLPNTVVDWPANSSQTVTWDVANTTLPPVSCANVDVTLSVDGGGSFATTLLSGTPNDGSEQVTVPNLGTSRARVMVGCSSNIFFDVSNADFTISGGPTATPTGTGIATNTPGTTSTAGITPSATATTQPTSTAVAPSATATTAATETAESTVTVPAVTATATACTITFSDVPPDNTFYANIRCLACRGIVNGYPDGTFLPNNPVTRGQLAKIVSQSAGFTEPVSGQTFEDVAPGSTFYDYIERLASRQVMGGYQCGVDPAEPCGPENRPYFRPNAGATRGQLTKIVSNAAGFNDTIPDTQYQFTDVEPGSTFWLYVERLLLNRPGVMSGYPCGGPGEPCDSENRNYFRPNNPLTRGQTSKIVANTFFPDCETPGAK